MVDTKLDRCLDTLDETIAVQRETKRLTIRGGDLWFWLLVVPAAALCAALMAWSKS